jgi:hypothetical protein
LGVLGLSLGMIEISHGADSDEMIYLVVMFGRIMHHEVFGMMHKAF